MNRNGFISLRDFAILAGIILLGIMLRTVMLGHEPLFIDEGYSVWFSSQDWGYLWGKVPEFETHPPFYYSVLKLWREAFGSDEAALRMLSVLVSVLIIPLVYVSARLLDRSESGRALALLAALLTAAWSYQIEYAQEVRTYAFLAFATALTLPFLIWVIQNPGRLRFFPRSGERRDSLALFCMLGLGAGLALHMWLHNLGIMLAGLMGLFLLLWWAISCRFDRTVFLSLLLIGLFALLLYSPNIPNLLGQIAIVSDNFWVKVPSRSAFAKSFVELYGLPLWWIIPGYIFLRANFLVTITILFIGLAGFGRICFRQSADKAGKSTFLLLLLLLFGPVIISLAITYLSSPVFLSRTLISVQVPLMIVLASVPWVFPAALRPAVIGLMSVVAIASATAIQWEKMTGEVSVDRTYPMIIEHILQDENADAPVLIVPNSIALSVDYYQERRGVNMNLHPLPGPYPAIGLDSDYPVGLGVPAVIESAVEDVIQEIKPATVVWVISRKNDLFDPDGIVQSRVEKDWPCRELVSGNGTTYLSLTRYSTREDCPLPE